MKDAKVIKALKHNDALALKGFYNAHREAFLAFAKKYPIDNDVSVDVYQDAIIALRENAIKGKLDNFKK